MLGFEPWTSVIGSDRFGNRATIQKGCILTLSLSKEEMQGRLDCTGCLLYDLRLN